MKRQHATLGPEHSNALPLAERLAETEREQGHNDEAIVLFEKTLARQRVSPVPTIPTLFETMSDLAEALRSAGSEFERGNSVARGDDEGRKDDASTARAQTIISMNTLARGYLLRKLPPSPSLCCMKPHRLPTRITQPAGLRSRRGVFPAAACWVQRRFADAKPLLIQGFLGLKQREGLIPARYKNRVAEAGATDRCIYEGRPGIMPRQPSGEVTSRPAEPRAGP